LTTSANKVVKPVHAKAMPVLLLTDSDIETLADGTHRRGAKASKAVTGRCGRRAA
jgi:putative SOS response-associated peptidase YedK